VRGHGGGGQEERGNVVGKHFEVFGLEKLED
jgi:hypothetical protein